MHVLSLSKGLKARGHEVEVLSMCEGPLVPEFEKIGVPVTVMPGLGQRARKDPLLAAKTVNRVRKVFRRSHPDIIHSHGPRAHFFTVLSSIGMKRPVMIATAHGSYKQFVVGHVETTRLKSRVKQIQYGFIDKYTTHLTDSTIAVCEDTRKDMVEDLRVQPGKVTVICNGTDETIITPDRIEAIRKEFGIETGHRVVTSVGRIAYHKGSHNLIEAMETVASDLPQARFIFVGEGPLEEELKQRSQSSVLRSRVIFAGSREDAMAIIAASDLVVSASLSEGPSMTLMETAMMSRACVATRVGGIPETVSDGETGLLTSPNDPAELATAITRLLEDDVERMQMGEAARRKWEREFTSERMVAQTEELYNRLLEKKQRGHRDARQRN